jgi:parallel beta-helix repeat protein
MRVASGLVALSFAALACPAPAEPDPCDVTLVAGIADASDIQAYLDDAADDSTICLSGEFVVDRALTASGKSGLTLMKAPRASEMPVLDFRGAGDPAGLSLSGMTDLDVRLLRIRDTRGHGLEVSGSSTVILHELTVEWSAGPSESNGLFGLRVIDSEDVRIDACQVSGAADAGIFARDSRDVSMRYNHAFGNVTGLQVENTERAHLTRNTATGNALGIFVVDLPTAPSGLGEVLVDDNEVRANDGVNFAPDGVLSSAIPSGIGVMVLATDTVEVTGNTIADNPTSGVMVVSFDTVALLSQYVGMIDPGYDGFPETIDIHDNTFADNGRDPASLFTDIFLLEQMPDLAWDGTVDTGKDNADGRLNLCIRDNGDADFINLDAVNLGVDKSTDLAPHDCSHPALVPVEPPPL